MHLSKLNEKFRVFKAGTDCAYKLPLCLKELKQVCSPIFTFLPSHVSNISHSSNEFFKHVGILYVIPAEDLITVFEQANNESAC